MHLWLHEKLTFHVKLIKPPISLKQEILSNHKSVLLSHGISSSDKDTDIPLLYWIPKLHQNPYKQRFITGSSACLTINNHSLPN